MARLGLTARAGRRHRRGRRRRDIWLIAATLAVVLVGCSPEANGQRLLEAVESDLRSAAIAMEKALTEHRAYPAGADTLLADLISGFSSEGGVEVLLVWSSDNAYCLEGRRDGVTAWYDSAGDGLTSTSCR